MFLSETCSCRVPQKVAFESRRQLAQVMIVPTPLFKVELVSSEREIELDGLPGYELMAIGTDSASGESLQIYSISLFDGEKAYVCNAWVSSKNTDNHLKDFKELSKSFRLLKNVQVNGDVEAGSESKSGAGSDLR